MRGRSVPGGRRGVGVAPSLVTHGMFGGMVYLDHLGDLAAPSMVVGGASGFAFDELFCLVGLACF
jgi:hypothetical protein